MLFRVSGMANGAISRPASQRIKQFEERQNIGNAMRQDEVKFGKTGASGHNRAYDIMCAVLDFLFFFKLCAYRLLYREW